MADYIATTAELTAVADAIREKGGTSEALSFPDGFVDAIGAIQTGGGGSYEYPKRLAQSVMTVTVETEATEYVN